MLHLASATSLSWWWLWHPLAGPGYQFWSGIASDVGEVTLLAGLIALLRHHNCAVRSCWRMGLRKPTAAGDFVCRRHAPTGHHDKTHAQVLSDHHEAARMASSA